ncbi:MAG: Ig-like domain-containing protein [Candidatus Omnitrophota bacterium]
MEHRHRTNKICLLIISISIFVFLLIPQISYAWFNVYVSAKDIPADGESTSEIYIQLIDDYIDPVSGRTVTLSLDPGYGTLRETTLITDGDGRASTTYQSSTTPARITIFITVEGMTGRWYINVFTGEIKAEDGISSPAEYMAVGETINFKANMIPEDVTGSYQWEIVNGAEYAQIVAGQEQQTVSVRGVVPSKPRKVSLKLMFKPASGTKWYDIEIHEFEVVMAGLEAIDTNTTAEGTRKSTSTLVMVNTGDRTADIILTIDSSLPPDYPKWSGTNVTGTDGSLTASYSGTSDSKVQCTVMEDYIESLRIDIIDELKYEKSWDFNEKTL